MLNSTAPMRRQLSTFAATVVVVLALAGNAAGADSDYRLVGGTWTAGWILGPVFVIESEAASNLVLRITTPGVLRDGGNEMLCGGYQPSGIAPNKSLCWNFVSPVSGTYTATTEWSPDGQVFTRTVTIDQNDRLDDPTLTAFARSVTSVRVAWEGVAGAGTYLVRLSAVPYDGVNLREALLPAGAREIGWTDVPMVAAGDYQLAVFAFGADLMSAEPVPPVVNLSSWGVFFKAVDDTTPPEVRAQAWGLAGEDGWYRSPVVLGWTTFDPESSIFTREGCGFVYHEQETAGTTYSCSATSIAGLTTRASFTVKIDLTPPTVEWAGNRGTYSVADRVRIDCRASDALSGLASSTCADVDARAYSFGAGTTTLTADAADKAGNRTTGSTSFDVVVTASGIVTLATEFGARSPQALRALLESALRAPNDTAQVQLFENFERAVAHDRGLASEQRDVLVSLARTLVP